MTVIMKLLILVSYFYVFFEEERGIGGENYATHPPPLPRHQKEEGEGRHPPQRVEGGPTPSKAKLTTPPPRVGEGEGVQPKKGKDRGEGIARKAVQAGHVRKRWKTCERIV